MISGKMKALPAAVTLCLSLAGCAEFGKVNQGKVIDYDAQKGVVTLIQDSNYKEPGNPKYDVLPPIIVQVPDDPKQMGPAPRAGKLMSLDSQKRQVVVFDSATQSFKSIEYKLIEQQDNVFRDDARVAGASFPVVDRSRKTIAVYLPRRRQLVTFSVPEEYLALPVDTWKAGDEIRYYYKNPGKALRLMNVSRSEVI